MGNSNWADKSYKKKPKIIKIGSTAASRAGWSWKDNFSKEEVKEILAEQKKK
jgi:hypothetical protein